MRDYGKIHTSFWTSETIRGMTEDGRTLAMYLMTCNHGTIAGVFRVPDGYVCDDLQWSIERVAEGFSELFAKGFARRCDRTKWVWVVKHFEWNKPENPNQRISAAKIAAKVPIECSWKPVFMRECWTFFLDEEPVIDEVYEGVCETLSEGLHEQLPKQLPEPFQESFLTSSSNSISKQNLKPKRKKADEFDAHGALFDAGVSDQVAKDWLQLRKAKRAPVTETVLKAVKEESEKLGITINTALTIACKRGWQGFEASWVKPEDLQSVKEEDRQEVPVVDEAAEKAEVTRRFMAKMLGVQL